MAKDAILQSCCWEYPAVWSRVLDPNKGAWVTVRWHIYTDAVFCSKCTLESTCDKQLYGNLPQLSAMIKFCQWKFVGHCCQANEEPIFKVLFWTPQHGRRRHGRPTLRYPKLLENDTGMMVGEIQGVMTDWDLWQQWKARAKTRQMMMMKEKGLYYFFWKLPRNNQLS